MTLAAQRDAAYYVQQKLKPAETDTLWSSCTHTTVSQIECDHRYSCTAFYGCKLTNYRAGVSGFFCVCVTACWCSCTTSGSAAMGKESETAPLQTDACKIVAVSADRNIEGLLRPELAGVMKHCRPGAVHYPYL